MTEAMTLSEASGSRVMITGGIPGETSNKASWRRVQGTHGCALGIIGNLAAMMTPRFGVSSEPCDNLPPVTGDEVPDGPSGQGSDAETDRDVGGVEISV